MARIFKALLTLAVLGFIALTGYAYVGDMSPERSEVRLPVELTVAN